MERTVLLGFVVALAVFAQPEPPIGILRGEFIATTATAFEMRGPQKIVFTCAFDARSYFERENQRITAENIRAGETLEVVADRQEGLCYARTVHVIEPDPVSRRWRPSPSPTESFAPRGELMYSGLVTRQDQRSVTVKTRAGDVVLLKRPDTRYLEAGQRVDSAAVNSRVFVRAGRNLEGEIEAYQVIWGGIVKDEKK